MQLPIQMTRAAEPPVSQKTLRGNPNPRSTKMVARTPLRWGIVILAILAAVSLFVGPVYAAGEPDASAGRNVYISGMSYNPAVFFTGDKGTYTVYVTNGNSDQTVSVNHASFGDGDIKRTSGTYDATSTIGPLQTRSYSFSVVADADDGIYYPTFSLSYFGSLSIWQDASVQVDNTPLVVVVSDMPDTFSQGRKDTVSVQIANPRNNEVNNVILEVSGANATLMPATNYIGTLPPGESTTVNFTIVPEQPTTLELNVKYSNGDNLHNVAVSQPITFVMDKKDANPIITNVKVTRENGVYDVTGDVTNAGLQTANGVTVTSLSPAVPMDPFRSYIIGALKPDDFGSFEITFSSDDTTSVPLQLSYKDKDGNVITSQQRVSLEEASTSTPQSTQPGILLAIGVIIVIGIAGGGYLVMKRRKNQ